MDLYPEGFKAGQWLRSCCHHHGLIYNPTGVDPAGMGLWRGKDLSAQLPPVKTPGNRKQNDAVFLALPKNNPKSSGTPWVDPVLLIQLLPSLLQMFAAMRCSGPAEFPKKTQPGEWGPKILDSLRVRGSRAATPPRNQTFPRADKRDWGWLPAHGKSQPNLLTWSCLQSLLPH